MNEFRVNVIAPEGLGYGIGSISKKEITQNAQEESAYLDEIIVSKELLVPIDVNAQGDMLDDDGCGDGRGVKKTFQVINGTETEKKKSLNRAKIFGGGPAMAGAALLAVGDSNPVTGEEFFRDGIKSLAEAGIDYGAHTDDHAEAPKCGCGAIDNCPVILENSITFKEKISENIGALNVSLEGLDIVFENFRTAAQNVAQHEYSGKRVMDDIEGNEKVVKQLDGGHKEVAVVLNTIQGYTVDQEKIRRITDNKLQAFAVDVWRMQDISVRLYPEDDKQQLKAFQGMLVYTLATAATLTKGDLPVYMTESELDQTAA